MPSHAVETRRWTRREYETLVASGFFHPEERLELVDGELLRMTPQGSAHATAISLLEETLKSAFGLGFNVRAQMPLALDPDSEPEPDVAVVVGSPRDYRDSHPTTAVLVVEVADTTLTYDRERKTHLYARAGIPDYWILNLLDRCLEVYRQPVATGSEGPRYATKLVVSSSESVSPLARLNVSIRVADLLP
jgi:Uma2 family endonuclease